ncbi:MAG: ABC transporter permease [Bifidobacteriaceae bacterium]|nr:ABC transporter permease [Bifidobacteriaceae bacterium]
MKMLRDTYALFGRLLKHVLRSPDTIITVTIMPVAIMLLFVYVFGGAIETGADNYVNYMLPGILLMSIASGTAYTSVRLFSDREKGLFARFNSMPISRSSLLIAHVLVSIVSGLVTVFIITAIALIMGFRTNAGILQLLTALAVLTLFMFALTWLAVIAGLGAKSVDGASAFSYPLIFLPFISSAFVPTDTMPFAVRVFAEHQPVTSIVDAIRSLLCATPAYNAIWVSIAWCVAISVVGWLVGRRVR